MQARWMLTIGAFALAMTAVAAAAEPSGPPRPNVVLILIDNLGYQDAGCFGNREIKTPHIDRLAAEGVRLTCLYSASPTCSVSRASLLTGRSPTRHGLTWQLRTLPDRDFDENLGQGLAAGERMIPWYLKPLGYHTACFGKWNVGFAPGTRPTERGFDEYLGNASGCMDYYTHEYKGRNDMFRGTQPEAHRGEYSTTLYADAACDFLRRQGRAPFFLYVPFNAVHVLVDENFNIEKKLAVWEAPDEAFRAYGYPPGSRDAKQGYFATVTALDAAIGRILGQLDALDAARNTLVILFSDNGAFDYQMSYSSNGPFRTGKFSTQMVYEGNVRVMGLVRWPERFRPGGVCGEVLSSMDFLPMILAAAGTPLPADRELDGRDPTAVLAGEARSPHDVLSWQYKGARAVRHGNDKLVIPRPESAAELYDLAADPGEQTDLAAARPEVVARLRDLLPEIRTPPAVPDKP